MEIIKSEGLKGERNTISNVPDICSVLIFLEQVVRAKVRYPERAIPIKAKGNIARHILQDIKKLSRQIA
ncbi:MAG: hypothetical protein Q8N80_04250 [Candidatus Omnitrophota bacterium]|nr:hypothetical protein [Candidatus Omnitrophota bacterium]